MAISFFFFPFLLTSLVPSLFFFSSPSNAHVFFRGGLLILLGIPSSWWDFVIFRPLTPPCLLYEVGYSPSFPSIYRNFFFFFSLFLVLDSDGEAEF